MIWKIYLNNDDEIPLAELFNSKMIDAEVGTPTLGSIYGKRSGTSRRQVSIIPFGKLSYRSCLYLCQ